ncbi:MAG: hypothetical protein CR974_00465 [Gammaproteobacteria bacterium]|nr:MAG: hypothetical protein CR974_00465 [Gammaproteobacteria bacterium]
MTRHASKLLCSSKKYVLLSWDILWIPINFIGYYTFYPLNGKDLFLTLAMAATLFFALLVFLLSRLFYVNCYEDYIEIKHILIPFFRRRVMLDDLNGIFLELVWRKTEYGNINCIVVYFNEQGKTTKKTYWNVASFYDKKHKLFYGKLAELYGFEFDRSMGN